MPLCLFRRFVVYIPFQNCYWPDLNPGSLVLEATALATVPQPLSNWLM